MAVVYALAVPVILEVIVQKEAVPQPGLAGGYTRYSVPLQRCASFFLLVSFSVPSESTRGADRPQ